MLSMYNFQLRSRILKFVSIVVLLVCIGSHVSELLDTWDNTFQTGNDIESVFVILALTVGGVLALASTAVLLIARRRSFADPSNPVPLLQPIGELILSTHSPPIVPIRI